MSTRKQSEDRLVQYGRSPPLLSPLARFQAASWAAEWSPGRRGEKGVGKQKLLLRIGGQNRLERLPHLHSRGEGERWTTGRVGQGWLRTRLCLCAHNHTTSHTMTCAQKKQRGLRLSPQLGKKSVSGPRMAGRRRANRSRQLGRDAIGAFSDPRSVEVSTTIHGQCSFFVMQPWLSVTSSDRPLGG